MLNNVHDEVVGVWVMKLPPSITCLNLEFVLMSFVELKDEKY